MGRQVLVGVQCDSTQRKAGSAACRARFEEAVQRFRVVMVIGIPDYSAIMNRLEANCWPFCSLIV